MNEVQDKSSRFTKIAGDFGEALFLYWLSKYGFEAASIDYTGIDLLAYNKKSKERFGISVKTRTRALGKEQETVSLKKEEILKIKNACEYFNATPCFGFVVDRSEGLDCLLLRLSDLLEINPGGEKVIAVGVREHHWKQYKALNRAWKIHFKYESKDRLAIK